VTHSSSSALGRRLRRARAGLAAVAVAASSLLWSGPASASVPLALPLLAAEAQADPKPAPQGKVQLEVMVVHANQSGKVDPKLKEIMKQLRFLNFTGFQLLDTYPATLTPGKEASFTLVGNRKLKIQLLSKNATAAKIRIRMFSGSDKVVDTTVSIHRNRSFIVAGPKYKDGVLILPLTVSY